MLTFDDTVQPYLAKMTLDKCNICASTEKSNVKVT